MARKNGSLSIKNNLFLTAQNVILSGKKNIFFNDALQLHYNHSMIERGHLKIVIFFQKIN